MFDNNRNNTSLTKEVYGSIRDTRSSKKHTNRKEASAI